MSIPNNENCCFSYPYIISICACESGENNCYAPACQTIVDECAPRPIITGVTLNEQATNGYFSFTINFSENLNCYKNVQYSITGSPWTGIKQYSYYKNFNNIYTTKFLNDSSFTPSFLNVDSIGISNSYGCYGMMGNIPEITEEIILGQPPLDSGIEISGIYDLSINSIINKLNSFEIRLFEEDFSLMHNPGVRLGSFSNPANYSCFMSICDTGNEPYIYDTTKEIGKVDYGYQIQKFELTIQEYLEFLNTCFKNDPDNQAYIAINNSYGLWPSNMGYLDNNIKINRYGIDGSYSYSISGSVLPTGYYSKLPAPIPAILALRLCNWLHNKAENPSTTYTDDGAYDLGKIVPYDINDELYGYIPSGQNNRVPLITRKSCAKYFIPNNNEWFKAAFYKSSGLDSGYWQIANNTNLFEGISTVECSGSSIDIDASLASTPTGCIPSITCKTENFIALRFNNPNLVCVPPTPPPTNPPPTPTPTPTPTPPRPTSEPDYSDA